MNREMIYRIDREADGQSVGAYLKQKGVSHPILVHLKKTNESILVNDEWVHVNHKLKMDDTLKIRIIEEVPSKNIPPSFILREKFEKMIVYEDEDILLLNKPAGLPIHPSMGHHEDSLANYCAYYYANYHKENGAFVFRCVNRLDRDTSGLVLIAKNMLSSAKLSAQQLERKIHRTYIAICDGEVPNEGTIDLPIARKENSVIERCVDLQNGESAITHYWKIDYKEGKSLVKIQLETGRTHQIRVHMKAIGHPLPGDFLYNPDCQHISRQALHSYSLEFFHPISGERLVFYTTIPEDFKFINWAFDDKYKYPLRARAHVREISLF